MYAHICRIQIEPSLTQLFEKHTKQNQNMQMETTFEIRIPGLDLTDNCQPRFEIQVVVVGSCCNLILAQFLVNTVFLFRYI